MYLNFWLIYRKRFGDLFHFRKAFANIDYALKQTTISAFCSVTSF